MADGLSIENTTGQDVDVTIPSAGAGTPGLGLSDLIGSTIEAQETGPALAGTTNRTLSGIGVNTTLEDGGNAQLDPITFTNNNNSAESFTFTPSSAGATYGQLVDAINARDDLSATVGNNELTITNTSGDTYSVSIGGSTGTATAALDGLTSIAPATVVTGSSQLENGGNALLGDIEFSNGNETFTFTPTATSTYDDLVTFINDNVTDVTASIGANGLVIENSSTREFTVTQENSGGTAQAALAGLTTIPASSPMSANELLFESGTSPQSIAITTDQGTAVFEADANTTVADLVDYVNQEVSNVSASFINGEFSLSGSGDFTIEGLNTSVLNTSEGSIDGYNAGNTITLDALGTDTFSSTFSGTLSIGGQDVTVNADNGASLIQQLTDGLGSDYDVGVNEDEQIEITYTGSTTGTLDIAASSALGALFLNDSSLNGDATLTGTMTVGQTVNNSQLIDQFNDLLSQIDAANADASYKGINLLNGSDLTVNFNEDRTSSIELSGVTFDAEEYN